MPVFVGGGRRFTEARRERDATEWVRIPGDGHTASTESRVQGKEKREGDGGRVKT